MSTPPPDRPDTPPRESPDEPSSVTPETRTAAVPSALATGALLAGRYRILARLGSGGMGVVYRARDERLDVEVAVKVLRPEIAAEGEVSARFNREILLARQVSHRHVVRIHDLGEEGELRFLTMDLVPGRTLKQVLAEEGPLPPPRAARIARQLAEALAAAHREGVVHRDLKPANVLIDDDGEAFVTDFGVARSITATALTSTGHVVGTPAYLSPEQAGGEPVDGRSDLYSLGLILHEMLAGEPAFPDGTWAEVVSGRLHGAPRRLRRRAPEVPAWLAEVVERCLHRDPARRFQSAEAVAEALAAGEEGRAGGAARWRRRLLHGARRWGPWLGAAVLAALLAAGLWYWMWGAVLPAEEDAPPPRAAVPSVAVLPFAAAGDDPAGSPQAVAEIVAGALAESPALHVADSLRVLRTVEDLKLQPGLPPEAELAPLAELLAADHLLSGRVVTVPGQVRLAGRLASVTGGRVEVERIDVAAEDLLHALETFTAELGRRLAVAGAPQGAPLGAALSRDPEALAAHARGVAALRRGDPVAAAPHLEQAVETDPAFTAAWVRLAEAYAELGYLPRARDAAARAVAGLPASPGRVGHEARALLASLEGEPERAVAMLRELVDAYPHDHEARVALAEALGDLGRFTAAGEVLNGVVEADPSHPRAWFLLGKFAILSGEYQRAADDYLVRALVVQNRLGNRQGRADALNALGLARYNLGELEPARQRFEEAVELRRAAGDRRGVAASLTNLGLVETQRGGYDLARRSFEESLAIRREIGDRHGIANVYNYFGLLEEEQGSYRDALEHFRRALELRRELGDERGVAESLNNVGFANYLLGEYDNASVYWDRALEIYQRDENREGVLVTRQNLGLLAIARADWETALTTFVDTLEEARALRLLDAEAVSLGNLGRVAGLQGRYDAAFASLDEALARVEELGDPRGLAEFHLVAAAVALEIGAGERAAGHLERAEEWLRQGGNREQRAELARLRGLAALAEGRLDAARGALERALGEAESSGSRALRLAADLALARLALAGGRAAEAAARAGEGAEEAAAMGHVELELRALEVAATAQLAAGRAGPAAETAGRAAELCRRHAPWGGAWRVHRLHAEALAAAGGAGVEAARAAAAAEVERLRGNLSGPARRAFDGLPEVRDLG